MKQDDGWRSRLCWKSQCQLHEWSWILGILRFADCAFSFDFIDSAYHHFYCPLGKKNYFSQKFTTNFDFLFQCWTATNVVHNLITFFVFHWTKSTPWLSPIEHGNTRRLTHWEQIDHGTQFTPTRIFLTIVPIILFMLTSFYTKYDSIHFVINFLSLVFVLVPKHHSFHKVRLFGINKYWISNKGIIHVYLLIWHRKQSIFLFFSCTWFCIHIPGNE